MTNRTKMTKITVAQILFSVLVLAVACKKNDDSGGGGSFATTPQAPAQNCADLSNPACQPAQPNFYQQNAPNFLGYQWNYANGYCGCPSGYRPVFNLSWGLACSPYAWFPNAWYYQVAAVNVQSLFNGPQNGQWTSVPQVTYSPATSGSASSCGAQASLICDSRVANSCANGATCRQVGGGTYMGLCTTGTGDESYATPMPYGACLQYNGWGWVNICNSQGQFLNQNGTQTGLPR